jgi:hypothetical protein
MSIARTGRKMEAILAVPVRIADRWECSEKKALRKVAIRPDERTIVPVLRSKRSSRSRPTYTD